MMLLISFLFVIVGELLLPEGRSSSLKTSKWCSEQAVKRLQSIVIQMDSFGWKLGQLPSPEGEGLLGLSLVHSSVSTRGPVAGML